MRSLLVLGVALALLLTACAPPAQTAPTAPQAPSAPAPSAPSAPTSPSPGAPATAVPAQPSAMPPAVAALVQKGEGYATTGYGYLYVKNVNGQLAAGNLNSVTVEQRGATRRVAFPQEVQLTPTFFMATVILDTSAHTATAYCTRATCNGSRLSPAPRTVVYDDYTFPTPTDWLPKLQDVSEVGSEQIQGRTTDQITATIDGVQSTVWLDSFSGIPLEVDQGTTQYSYQSLTLGATDADLQP